MSTEDDAARLAALLNASSDSDDDEDELDHKPPEPPTPEPPTAPEPAPTPAAAPAPPEPPAAPEPAQPRRASSRALDRISSKDDRTPEKPDCAACMQVAAGPPRHHGRRTAHSCRGYDASAFPR